MKHQRSGHATRGEHTTLKGFHFAPPKINMAFTASQLLCRWAALERVTEFAAQPAAIRRTLVIGLDFSLDEALETSSAPRGIQRGFSVPPDAKPTLSLEAVDLYDNYWRYYRGGYVSPIVTDDRGAYICTMAEIASGIDISQSYEKVVQTLGACCTHPPVGSQAALALFELDKDADGSLSAKGIPYVLLAMPDTDDQNLMQPLGKAPAPSIKIAAFPRDFVEQVSTAYQDMPQTGARITPHAGTLNPNPTFNDELGGDYWGIFFPGTELPTA